MARVDAEAPAAKAVAGYRSRYELMLPIIGMDWDGFCDRYHIPIRISPTGYRRW